MATFPFAFVVIPSALHGSIEPLGKTVLVNGRANPPLMMLVRFTDICTSLASNCGPKISAHCCTKKLTGTVFPNGCAFKSVD